MSYLTLLLAGLFIPLFPLSLLFNALFARVRHPVMRGLLLLAWPQIGLAIVFASNPEIPFWLPALALATSLLYALRALVLRELGLWTSFIATSSWALLWIIIVGDADKTQLQIIGIGISVPLLLMASLVALLERRFGAAYLGLYRGLAQSLPRFTGVLAVVVLAIIATPIFPGFFVMLSMMFKAMPAAPFVAVGLGIVWLLWSWAGARLLQGLITGPQRLAVADLSCANMWLYIAVLAGLMFAGVYWFGAML